MKRAYTKPILQLEEFIPQEYVANCNRLTQILVKCSRPGTDGHSITDGTNSSYGVGVGTSVEGQDPYYKYDDDHTDGYYYHGYCGYIWNEIYTDGTLKGIEKVADGAGWYYSVIDNVQIGGISDNHYDAIEKGTTSFSDLIANKTYEASWQSYDKHGSTYHHYGALKTTGTTSFS